MRGNRLAFNARLVQRNSRHNFRRDVGDREAGSLRHKWNRAAGARIYLQHVEHLLTILAFDRILDVHQPDNAHVLRHGVCRLANFLQNRAGKAVRRQGTGRVAGMDAGLFDVLHDAHDNHTFSVADRIDIDLNRIFQKAVDQYGLALRDDKRLGDEFFKLRLIVADLHSPAAKHKAWPNEIWISDSRGLGASFYHGPRDAIGRLAQAESVEQLLEFFSVLGVFDGIDAGADDRHARTGKRASQIKWRLAAELH